MAGPVQVPVTLFKYTLQSRTPPLCHVAGPSTSHAWRTANLCLFRIPSRHTGVPLRCKVSDTMARSEVRSLTSVSLQVPEYLVAGARQFGFMLRGLKLMEPKLAELNIPFFLVKGDPIKTIPEFVKKVKAACLVTDFASLRLGREWRDEVSHTW